MDKTKEQSLQLAIQMERDGKAFYLKAATGGENVLAQKIFEELARQEDFHIDRILQIYEQMKKEQPIKEWITTVAGVGKLEKVFQESLQEKAQASENDLNALRFGLEIEDKSVKFYENLAISRPGLLRKTFLSDDLSRREGSLPQDHGLH